jgi:D-beta-D-heptose 7-phosphate kinase/D-beta-D-heptose 1-phosphate adenosyltransferase
MCISKKIYRNGSTFPDIGDKKIVFTNGCFDILHPGHLHYLCKAKSYGDVLIVALNSDSSIKKLKGLKRPVNNFEFRSTMLSYLDFVDLVVEFDSDTPVELIQTISPNVLVKGADYYESQVAGADFVKSNGGQVVLVEFLKGFSSTEIIKSIKNATWSNS